MEQGIFDKRLFKAYSDEKEYIVPEEVEEIGGYAFKGNESIEKIVVPENVKKLGYGCFAEVPNLKSVLIRARIKKVSENAFNNSKHLERVDLPDCVESIEANAFRDCESLKEIVFPSSLKEIGNCAFYGCNAIIEVKLPESVEKIGALVFYECQNLRKVFIPDSVKSIGDGTFKDCPELKEISLPKGCRMAGRTDYKNLKVTRRTGSSESNLTKKQLSGTDENETAGGSPSSGRVKKPKQTTKESVVNSGKIQFGDDVTIDLPSDYGWVDTTDNKGNRVVIIGLDPQEEAGKTVYNYQVAVRTVEKRITGEDILDYIDELNKGAYGFTRVSTVPPYSVVMWKKQSVFGDSTVVVRSTANNIRLSESKVFSVQILGGEVGEDTGYFLTNQSAEEADRLHKIMKSVLIKGKGLFEDGVFPNMTTKNNGGLKNKQAVGANDLKYFWAFDDQDLKIRDGRVVSKSLFERINSGKVDSGKGENPAKASTTKPKDQPKAQKVSETSGINRTESIYRDGNRLVFGNLWSMEMPYACRLVKSVLDDPEAENYSIYNGNREIWNFLVANEVNKQTEKALANSIVYTVMQKTHQASDLITWQFRKDDRLSVDMKLAMGMDGQACGQLTVKADDNEYIMITEMPEIDDIQEALNSISNDNIGMAHPFGMEWESQWSTILRMITSIRLVNEKDASPELGQSAELYKGITCRLPQELKYIGEEDGSRIYITGGHTDRSKASLTVYIHESELDGSLEPIRIEPLFKAFAMQQGRGFGLVIRDDHEEGFYKNLSYYPHANGAVRIHALKEEKTDLSIALIPGDSENRLPQYEVVRLANAIFDNLHLSSGSDCEVIPETLVPAPDYAHEHFDLVESHSYTTHRSADFIGQTIRNLMNKCGKEQQEAYALMTIPEDDYDLDQEAIRLAKVFRLNPDLFDQYADTEALIRKGMFSDARMYHALRSLAWTLSRMSDRSGRDPADWSYDELNSVGELIKGKNYLNYWPWSYAAGLCDTYDWHVFFIPEHYLFTDCRNNTDLRYVTGKENRGGNTVSVFIPGMGGFGGMNRNNDIISRNEETLESLEALRKDLIDLLPVMQTIHDHLLEGRDRSKKLEGPLADALTAWCALAIAAKEPFYSEEAADTPEADAALEEPLERPTDKLDDKPVVKKTKETQKPVKAKSTTTAKETAKSKTTSGKASKTTAPAKSKPATVPDGKPENIDSFDGTYGFAFPAGYSLEWETGEDFKRRCFIVYGPYYKDNGEKDYRFRAQLSVGSPEDPLPGERPLQALRRINPQATFATLSANPKAELMIKAVPMNLLGRTIKLYALWLLAEKNAKEYFLVNFIGTWNDDYSQQIENYRRMIDVVNAFRINREALPSLTDSPEELLKKMPPVFDDNAHTITGNVELNISVNGEHVGSTTIYGDETGNIRSRKKYTADMMPPGTEDPEKMAEELNAMDPQQAEQMLNLLIGMNELNDALSDLNNTVDSMTEETDSMQSSEENTQTASAISRKTVHKNTEMKQITVKPKNKKKIADSEFEKYREEGELIIPEGIVEIGEKAFTEAKMQAVVLPHSLQVINDNAFSECPNLGSIEIQDGLQRIGFWALGGCPKLTDIYLPDSIVYVDHSAFYDNLVKCTSQITVHLSEKTALRLESTKNHRADLEAFCAKQIEVDGEYYQDLLVFVKEHETRKEKKKQKTNIERQIASLENERENLKGLFAGFKKNKLQKQIDELKAKLRRL